MELMASRWTDDRMDDLQGQVVELGRRMDDGFRELRQEMNSRFDAMDARLDALQRTMIMFGASMFAAMLGLFAALLGLILTQL